MTELHDVLTSLARARKAKDEADQSMRTLRTEFELRDVFQEALAAQKLANSAIDMHTTAAKMLAVELYAAQEQDAKGNRPKTLEDGVKIRVAKSVEYPADEALAWARDNLPGALKLDATKFEKYAVDFRPDVDWLTIRDEPQATIPSDLSWLIEL
jgi:hypothetical protein